MSRPALTGQALILYLKIFEQSATENNHLQCNWSTINNLILKFCPKFQVLIFRFSEVDDLLEEKVFYKKIISLGIFFTFFTGEKCAKRKYFLEKPHRSEDDPEMVHLGFEGLS